MKTEFKFGSKVEFKNQSEVHVDLRDKHFCLVGFCDCAFALIEWADRGGYNFEFYSGKVTDKLIVVGEPA